MWPNLQFPADLVTFTDKIRKGKLQFLCNGRGFLSPSPPSKQNNYTGLTYHGKKNFVEKNYANLACMMHQTFCKELLQWHWIGSRAISFSEKCIDFSKVIEKGCIGNEWVKVTWFILKTSFILKTTNALTNDTLMYLTPPNNDTLMYLTPPGNKSLMPSTLTVNCLTLTVDLLCYIDRIFSIFYFYIRN